jgi:hypothetical protein
MASTPNKLATYKVNGKKPQKRETQQVSNFTHSHRAGQDAQ